MNPQMTPWHVVAQQADLAPRHVFHAQLYGIELALWRADDGTVNAWENRCPHRSVRLTLGVNTGQTLRCQYHGWQYRNGDGRCSFIPASSDAEPPASLCARRFAAVEANGYVWVSLDAARTWPAPDFPGLPLALRALPIRADLEAVAAALLAYRDDDAAAPPTSTTATRTGSLIEVQWQTADGSRGVRFWLQPASAGLTVVHAAADVGGSDAVAARHRFNQYLSAVRRRLERQEPATSAQPAGQPAACDQVVAFLPPAGPDRPAAPPRLLRAEVVSRWMTAQDIVGLRLALPEGERPAISAGAHVDVHTPNGFVRPYSLVNAPDERDCFVLGVKREPQSRGGSRDLHEHVRLGDTLTVSVPRNHFALAPGAGATLFAGGIGITPILAMAAQLQHGALPFALHYFARGAEYIAFGERLERLRNVQLHLGLSNDAARDAVDEVLREVPPGHHIYVCGPLPLIELVRELSRVHGIGADRVHYELFANAVSHDADKPFRVRLERSGCEFAVPAGVALSDAIRAQGIAIATSCEQGVCGSCLTAVSEGTPEHRDVYLTDEEKAGGRCMLPCVSRSHSGLLVLDL
ncbi:Rieske 2Fe-2S domain-containing protein [Cupriavidus alkaliphilus]|uniref:Rieske 2Fe-2S domain-containing protein n=1 Tax=Cupriavidus alkaliphilus TaxID=942866 RepID=UPI000DC50F00|nr:Rieske 2Fe-2S domain-containing protein [Cupriavidus alkaliphilus]RAS09221.1 ferredoxin-NADP reductase [Cupriavidus alkaliphilus]